MLPQFKISPEVLRTLYQLASTPGVPSRLSGSMIGTKSSPHHFLSLKIEDCKWHVKQGGRAVGDFMVTLRGERDGERRELELAWDNLMHDVVSRSDDVPLEPLHLCKSFCYFSPLSSPPRLRLHFTVLHPSLSLQFTPIPPLKISSSPLSVQLVKDTKKATRFLSGYLSIDQSKRAVVLLQSDPNVGRYPMMGVWATGVQRVAGEAEKMRMFPFLHPLVWSAAVRYLHTSTIRSRLSPSPESHTFLFIYFDPIPHFYEVSSSVLST